jgi:uncharacterized metal-binding protein
MAGEVSCTCGNEAVTLIFTCSGASNVGQIAHLAGLRLSEQGIGDMSCLAGVGAHISGFVVSARDCDKLVAIDGCPQHCALKTFEHHSIRPAVHVCLTEMGIKKSHGVPVTEQDVDRAVRLIADKIGSR